MARRTTTSLPVIPSVEAIRTHDNTMMSDLAYCERWYALRHVLNKKPMQTRAALSFGKLVHLGLEAGFEAIIEGRDVIEAIVPVMLEAPFEDPLGDFRTRGRAITTVTEYFQNYGSHPDWEILMTETPFEVEDDEGFRWGGVIDLIVRYQGRIWAVDHKTTTRFGAYYFEDFKRAPQMLGYTWGGSQLQGEPLAGVIINVIALRKDDNRFAQRAMFYPDWLIEEWRAKMIVEYQRAAEKRAMHQLDLEQHRDPVNNPHTWLPNIHNCVGKYGRCAAFDYCDTRPALRPKVLATEFEDNTWDWSDIDE